MFKKLHQKTTLLLLFIGLSVTAFAAKPDYKVYKEWLFIDSGPVKIAMTYDTKEKYFGQTCLVKYKQCFYMLNNNITCGKGDEISIYVNADSGSFLATGTCTVSDAKSGSTYLQIKEFDEMDEAVASGKKIGFAIPIGDDGFSTTLFSLKGSKKAIKKMREKSYKEMNNK